MRMTYCRLKDQSGHEAGRMLLAELYRAETGQDLPPILTTQRGKPYFAEGGLHFSISHTRNHAFCVLSDRNVAIDCEEIGRKVNQNLPKKVLSEPEWTQYQCASDKDRAFLTFWVLKEAAAKLSGQGLRGYPNKTNFSLDDPRVTEIDGCLVAVLEGE